MPWSATKEAALRGLMREFPKPPENYSTFLAALSDVDDDAVAQIVERLREERVQEPFYSERGFAQHLRDFPTDHGETVSVYASSADPLDHVWLKLEGEAFIRGPVQQLGTGERIAQAWLAAHCSVEQAKTVRDALDAWIKSMEGEASDVSG